MSRGDRGERSTVKLISIAALFLVFLITASGAVVWGLSKQAEYEGQAERSQTQYASRTYSPERNACMGLPPQDQTDCIAKATDKAREYQRGEQDLVAQRTMAVWTFLMGSAAIVGVFLSAFGVFLVWTTFNATRQANEIARQIGEAQTRAYIGLDQTRIDLLLRGEDDTIMGLSVTPIIKNAGNSPAFCTKLWNQILIIDRIERQPFPSYEIADTTNDLLVCTSGGNITLVSTYISLSDIASFQRREKRIFHLSYVRYQDVFYQGGPQHIFTVCTEIMPEMPVDRYTGLTSLPNGAVSTRNYAGHRIYLAGDGHQEQSHQHQ